MIKKSILITDDIKSNRDLASLHLEDYYELDFALNGSECIDKIITTLPDLLLLDIKMPLVDGWEVCRVIREELHLEDLPIIVISSKDHVQDLIKKYKINCFITLPYTHERIMDAVKDALS